MSSLLGDEFLGIQNQLSYWQVQVNALPQIKGT